ncbi:jg16727 [Pararge aegeria aegeria]|uniref:Jg16727 protein n=1 Tax=Pararge aegeria aegeria TaxID=348720 RepID=A0A8S4S4X5_9NEOP|nr:jg16727 [Pararge aegeria aegeria]
MANYYFRKVKESYNDAEEKRGQQLVFQYVPVIVKLSGTASSVEWSTTGHRSPLIRKGFGRSPPRRPPLYAFDLLL